MPTISPQDLKVLDDLRKEYRIVFAGKLEPRQWPELHRPLMERVAALGSKTFSSYTVDTSAVNAPWRAEVKAQARKLVEVAKRNSHRNESTWRMSCEPLVLARLSSEVVCRYCRQRVWRSEIETSFDDDSRGAVALRDRQKAREPCRCPRIVRSEDKLEAIGLNPLFGHREDELVKHDPAIAARLGKRIQRPDAIFGLRCTRNLEDLSHDTQKILTGPLAQADERQLHEILQPSPVDQPLDQNGDELLYPFLVLEAKSGKSDCDWNSIQIQTAFPIRTFLETQNRLFKTGGSQSRSRSSPLVWFFASRGEDWRVSIAFTAKGGQDPRKIGDTDYRGSITSLDDALQLLCDYVFDWARDTYRQNILGKLRMLVSGHNDATSEVYSDGDILSTQNIHQLPAPPSHARVRDYDTYGPTERAFMACGSKSYEVRHAAFVTTGYRSVFVTRDDVHTLLDFFTPKKLLCRFLLDQMAGAMWLEGSAIGSMEEPWTGTTPTTQGPAPDATTRFHTGVSCIHHLSGHWRQTRELHVLAIAEDAWAAVVEAENLHRRKVASQPQVIDPTTDLPRLLESISRLKDGTPEDILLSCISRRAVTLRVSPPQPGPSGGGRQVGGDIFGVPSDGTLFHLVCDMSIVRALNPRTSFVRYSSAEPNSLDELAQKRQSLNPRLKYPGALHPSEDGCVLVYSKRTLFELEKSPVVCLYLVNWDLVAPPKTEVTQLVRRALETRDVHHTTRCHGRRHVVSQRDNPDARKPWNLQDMYGILSEIDALRILINSLDTSVPLDRLGSPRERDAVISGEYLLTRTRIPWSDPRQRRGMSEERLFFIYKLVSREIRYWKGIAVKKRAEGLGACDWCAKPLPSVQPTPVVCRMYDNTETDNKFDWFYSSLMGEDRSVTEAESGAGNAGEVHGIPSERPLRLNVRWNRVLRGYPDIEEPFEDMRELLDQCQRFRRWLARNKTTERLRLGLELDM